MGINKLMKSNYDVFLIAFVWNTSGSLLFYFLDIRNWGPPEERYSPTSIRTVGKFRWQVLGLAS